MPSYAQARPLVQFGQRNLRLGPGAPRVKDRSRSGHPVWIDRQTTVQNDKRKAPEGAFLDVDLVNLRAKLLNSSLILVVKYDRLNVRNLQM
jgi:hypothetical protein